MNTILIYGNNKISTYLHTAFGEAGLVTVDITNKINSLDDPKDIYAVIDVSNADTSTDEATDIIHNTGEIKEILDLAAKVNSPYIFIYREREETHPESSIITAIDFVKTYSDKKSIKYATIQIEDIYGTDINTSLKLEEFISSITSGSNILTVDADENEHYLLHQKDFISGLKEIIKILNTTPVLKTKHYTLYPEDPITEIELAHFIKDLTDMEPEIVYTHDDIQTSFVLPEAETSYPENWYPTIKLEAGILDLFDYYGIPILDEAEDELTNENLQLADEYMNEDPNADDFFSQYAKDHDDGYNDPYKEDLDSEYANVDSDPIYSPAKKTKKIMGKKPRKAIAGLTAALILALSLPSLSFAYNFGSGLVYLSKASANIENLDLTAAYTNSNNAIGNLNKTDKIPYAVSLIASLAGVNSNDQHLFVETTKETAQAINYLSAIDLYATFKNLDSRTLAANSDVLGASTVAEPEYIDKSLEKIEKIDNNLENIETRNKFIRDTINKNLTSLNRNKEKLYKIKTIEPVLGQILGFNRKQNYLLLVQNLNSARSTGGRVDVYGILSAENGKLSIDKLEKSATAHDQIDLNGGVPAPGPIKAITDQEYMYIEDITWEPDFKNAAILAQNLYSYVGDEEVDGVIAIDTKLLEDLIGMIGEIRVGDKTITANNFSKQLTTSDSQQLLKDTFSYVFETLKSNPESFKLLEPVLYSALNNRNMLVYHKDESVYSNIIKNNWAGILAQSPTDEYLFIANNNLTDIPSNQISAEVMYEGQLPTDDKGYSRVIEIKYTNNSDADYLGHLMTIVPKDALLGTAEIISSSGKKNVVRSVRNSIYDSKSLYETDLYIATKQSVSFKVEFQSPPKDYKDQFIDISLQKQPGSASIPLNIKLVGDNTMNTNVIFDGDKELKFPL